MVTAERSFYTSILKECKESIEKHFSVDGVLIPPRLIVPIKAHYSFDYAQQVSDISDTIMHEKAGQIH